MSVHKQQKTSGQASLAVFSIMKAYIIVALIGFSHAASIGMDSGKEDLVERVRRSPMEGMEDLGRIYQIIGGVTRALGPALNGIGGMVGDSDPTARDVLRGIGTGLTMGGGIVDQFGNLFNPNGNPQQQPGMGGFGQGGMGGMGGMGGYGQGGMGGFGQAGNGGFGQGGMGNFGQGGMGGFGQAGMGGFGQGGDTVSDTGSSADL